MASNGPHIIKIGSDMLDVPKIYRPNGTQHEHPQVVWPPSVKNLVFSRLFKNTLNFQVMGSKSWILPNILCFAPSGCPWSTSNYMDKHPAGLEMGRVKTAFSCDRQEVNHAFRSVFSCFYVVHEGQFYCDFEFSLGFTVYSWHVGVRKRFLLEVSVPKTSAAAIFSGDLYIFAKYAPVFSNRAFPTTICLPSPLPCANVRPNEVIQFLFVFWARCQLIGNTGFDHTPARVDGASMNPEGFSHLTPPLRDVTHLQRSMTYVRTCKWTCRGVTSWECASTWTLLPHPTPPLRDVTHLQRSMTYVRTCKWTCRGVTSWECASTWTLLPHPTPPHPKEHI